MALDAEQRRAVESDARHLLVVAGPGSGKTRVVTERATRLLASGLPPGRLLLLTFTNKAAGEMRERMAELVGVGRCRQMPAGTFHSIGCRILRRIDPRFRSGRRPDFAIYDEDQQEAVIRVALRELEGPKRRTERQDETPAKLRAEISRRKCALAVPPEDTTELDAHEELFARLWGRYEERLRQSNAFDFDDLLLYWRQALSGSTAVGRELAERYEHVLVDEYQDTDRVQYDIVRALARRAHLCVVGDPRQAIYGFRGADHRNLKAFARDWPDGEVVVLRNNYRSAAPVVEASNALMRAAREDYEVPLCDMRSLTAGGEPVEYVGCEDAEDEARRFVDFAAAELQAGVPPAEVVAVYRSRAQSRALEEQMLRRGIPYRVIGGGRFYDRAVVRDAMAYAALVCNPASRLDYERIVNVPPRALGRETLAAVDKCTASGDGGPVDALARAVQSGALRGKAAAGASSLLGLLGRARVDVAAGVRPAQLLQVLIEGSGLYRYWGDKQQSGGRRKQAARTAAAGSDFGELERADTAEKQARDRLGQLDQLVSAAAAYESRVERPTLAGFVEEVALMTAQDELRDGAVVLSTIHGVKGLEFECVWVAGFEERMLPHWRSVQEGDEEEERRISFVALSRAKRRLVVSWCARRNMRGLDEPHGPSPFLADLPDSGVEQRRPPRGYARDIFASVRDW